MKILTSLLISWMPLVTYAASSLEGHWRTEDGSKLISIAEFNGKMTFSTSSRYGNGASVDWFFEFQGPEGRDVKVGETLEGRVRSVDGFYGCVFDETAQAKLDDGGTLKVHFPLITYHREHRSVRESRRHGGHYQERTIDWDGWGWVETRYSYPIDRYRTIGTECVIDQKNWITKTLTKTQSPF